MTGYASFEEFVVARRDALLRTAYLLIGNREDAEDLVQSALIKVVPKWSKIQDRPEGYIRQVLARESVNRWRGRRWREVPTEVVGETKVCVQVHPVDFEEEWRFDDESSSSSSSSSGGHGEEKDYKKDFGSEKGDSDKDSSSY